MIDSHEATLEVRRILRSAGVEFEEAAGGMPLGVLRDGQWLDTGWHRSAGLRYRVIEGPGISIRRCWHPTLHDAMRDGLEFLRSD